ncbi:unnamed protein product [Auanema sp. JU1783]|nr:unnamed protein product [Auanema sp. JU1783]
MFVQRLMNVNDHFSRRKSNFMQLLLAFYTFFLLIQYSVSEEASFVGKETWFAKVLDGCRTARFGNTTSSDLKCYWVNDKLNIFKIEVLSKSPILVRYHQLIHRRDCRRLIGDVNSMKLELAGVATTDPAVPLVHKTHRMANSTWVDHEEFPSFKKLFNRLQRTILSLDLSKAENFQVLSYDRNGHYAPHYDYIDTDVMGTIAKEGNRLATILTVLQTAKHGGVTTFPMINVNIRPTVGDVILWHNMEPSLRKDIKSLHAACPIIEGTKIAASLWVRSKGQELRSTTTKKSVFSLSPFINPSLRPEDVALLTRKWERARS